MIQYEGEFLNPPPDWAGLLAKMEPFGRGSRAAAYTKQVARTWPTEVASAARWRLGDAEFQSSVHNLLVSDKNNPNVAAPNTKALCHVLVRTNIVVSLNYTPYVGVALRRYIDLNSLKINVVTVDREELETFQFPSVQAQPQTIFLVHLHGRVSGKSSPVLDAWGYNAVQEDSPYYRDFLHMLFVQRDVLTIGVSWNDVPLRNAAADAFRRHGYLSQQHLALFYEQQPASLKDYENNPISPQRLFASAMRSTYGTEFMFVGSRSQLEVLEQLARPHVAVDMSDLRKLASTLDGFGDYESEGQHGWLHEAALHLALDTSDLSISRVLDDIHLRIVKDVINGEISWEIGARLERHLRHHRYLYQSMNGMGMRMQLWQQLASIAPHGLVDVDDRVAFDFMLGSIELGIDLSKHKISGWSARRGKLSPLLRKRLTIAKRVWRRPGVATDSMCIPLELLDLGWESIAAKSLNDIAEARALRAASGPDSIDVFDAAQRAEAVSRGAGCMRRKVKATILASIWGPDLQKGYNRVIGEARLLRSNPRFEVGLWKPVAAGFVACHIKLQMAKTGNMSNLARYVNEIRDVFEENQFPKDALSDSNIKYWSRLVPKSIQPIFAKLST